MFFCDRAYAAQAVAVPWTAEPAAAAAAVVVVVSASRGRVSAAAAGEAEAALSRAPGALSAASRTRKSAITQVAHEARKKNASLSLSLFVVFCRYFVFVFLFLFWRDSVALFLLVPGFPVALVVNECVRMGLVGYVSFDVSLR